MSTDRLYENTNEHLPSFEFNEAVARVFPDMLQRSIPGYASSIAAIGQLAKQAVTAGSRCYDLGCSLGAAALAMQQNIAHADCQIVAVDSSPAMIARCKEQLEGQNMPATIKFLEADIRDCEIRDASMAVMNYTLQFVPVADRSNLLKMIRDGMHDGGVFVLSEKVVDADPVVNQLLIDLHHQFKRDNAYSDLEISRKRDALRNVLVPETVETHLERLQQAGFAHAGVWMSQFNFVSIVAIC